MDSPRIATPPHDINRLRVAALSLDDYTAGLANIAGRWAISLRSVQGLPAVPGPEESDRRLRLCRADTRRHGRDFAGPAGGPSCCCQCASVLLSFGGAPRYLMGNWQLQHSRSLAFDEQRHQDIASIGKLDRVVMAVRHIWFNHSKLGNAEAGWSRPDPSLVVLNILLEG